MTDGTEFRDKLKTKIQEQASIKVLDEEAKQFNVEVISTGYNINVDFDDGSRCVIGLNARLGEGAFKDNVNKGMLYTDILYVSKDGIDTNSGTSWDDAFLTVAKAVTTASGDGDYTLIMAGAGTFDVNVANGLSMGAKKIHLMGTGCCTVFTNTHVSGTYVFKSETYFEISGCEVKKANNIDGIVTHGAGSKYKIYDVRFDNNHVGGGTENAIKLEHGYSHDICDIMISGVVAETTAICVCGAKWCHINRSEVYSSLKGIHFNSENSDQNTIEDVILWDCAIGLDIDAGNNQFFNRVKFISCTRNIDDEVGDHFWKDIRTDKIHTLLVPADLVGTTLTTGGDGNYGADTEIASVVSRDNPFMVTGVSYGLSAVENFGLRLSADSGVSHFSENVLEVWSANYIIRKFNINFPAGTQIWNKGTKISGSLRSASGVDTGKIWLHIVEL